MSGESRPGPRTKGAGRRAAIALGALALAGLSSLASGSGPREVEVQRRVDETWLVANLFAGQTHVPTDVAIVLTVGYQDFERVDLADGEIPAGARAELSRVPDGLIVPLEMRVDRTSMWLVPLTPLEPNTDYVLRFDAVTAAMHSIRMQPFPVQFSTRSAPRVTGLWRVEDTLVIAFSEPMDPDTLYLGHDSVDLLFEEDGELRSAATVHNLADYVWETRSNVFLLTSISFADDPSVGPLWVMVAGDVLGGSGVPLDGDGDEEPGELGDDFFEEVSTATLPWCFTREDIPDPCVHENRVPDLVHDHEGG